jgi:hypothetical protein
MNTTTVIHPARSTERGHVNTGKILLRILGILLVAYLAFFCYVAAHEWAGHVLADSLVFARHGTTIARLEVIVQWLTVSLQDGRWSVGLAPFRIGGEVVSAIYREPFAITDWERGFVDLSGSGMTTLISLIALAVLHMRKNTRRFPWFMVFFILYSMIFDQVLYTFTGSDPEPLVSAVLMGVNPVLFKGLVIGLALLQGWLLVRFVLRYHRERQAAASLA